MNWAGAYMSGSTAMRSPSTSMSPSAISGFSPASTECRVTARTNSDHGSAATAMTAVARAVVGEAEDRERDHGGARDQRADDRESDDRLARLERRARGRWKGGLIRSLLRTQTQAAAMPTESITTSTGVPWRPSMKVWWNSSVIA